MTHNPHKSQTQKNELLLVGKDSELQLPKVHGLDQTDSYAAEIDCNSRPPTMKFEDTFSIKKGSHRGQEPLRIMIVVWNLQGTLPPHNSIKELVDTAIRDPSSSGPDLLCIATQECQRSICLSFLCENKEEWQNALIQSAQGYRLAESETMNAMHTALLVREELLQCYTTEYKKCMRAGFLNILGNKGAISIVANLMGQSLQFINCHLEAHQNSNDKRNEVLIKITETLVEQDYRSEVFICGDLNYRIEMSKEEYGTYSQKQPNTDEQVKYSGMFDKDQLNNQALLQQHFLPFFEEQGVSFPPTYKMQPHGPEYHRGRIPGWTDRIFHRKGRAKEKGYKCMYNLYGTDHRPVIATFEVSLEETLSAFQEEVGVEGGRARHTCALI